MSEIQKLEETSELLKVSTSRFGEIEISADKLLEIPDGLVGFPDFQQFVIVQNPSGGPFQWLQSVDEPSLAFVVAVPDQFFENYEIPMNEDDLKSLKLTAVVSALVLVILVVPSDPKKITANLQGPMVINAEARIGKQLVLQVPGYSTRHPIFIEQTLDSSEAEESDKVNVVDVSGGKEC